MAKFKTEVTNLNPKLRSLSLAIGFPQYFRSICGCFTSGSSKCIVHMNKLIHFQIGYKLNKKLSLLLAFDLPLIIWESILQKRFACL